MRLFTLSCVCLFVWSNAMGQFGDPGFGDDCSGTTHGVSITGETTALCPGGTYSYTANIGSDVCLHRTWSVTNGTIVSGQGTLTVSVQWNTGVTSGSLFFTGGFCSDVANGCVEGASASGSQSVIIGTTTPTLIGEQVQLFVNQAAKFSIQAQSFKSTYRYILFYDGGSPASNGLDYVLPSEANHLEDPGRNTPGTNIYRVAGDADETAGTCFTTYSNTVSVEWFPLPELFKTGDLEVGSTTMIQISNSGVYPIGTSYQWYRNDQLLSGETATTLTISGEGYYKVQVDLPSGSGTGATVHSSLSNEVIYANEAVLATLPASENYVRTTVFNKESAPVPSGSSTLHVEDFKQSVAYVDGLGRTVQQVGVRSAPGYFDVVQPIEYDEEGRIQKNYLPFATSAATNKGAMVANAIQTQASYYQNPPDRVAGVTSTGVAYSEVRYDKSPLSAVLEAGAPGESWKIGGSHTSKPTYRFNTAADAILSISYSGTNYTVESNYSAGELLVGDTPEIQDQFARLIFTDKMGRTVATKKLLSGTPSSGTWIETLNIYDDFGRLVCTLQPEGVAKYRSSTLTLAQAIEKYGFEYRYDVRGRLIEKRAPGEDWVYFVFDDLDRPILTQDGVLRANDSWHYSKYDRAGRVVEGGIFIDTDLTTYGSNERETVQHDLDTGTFEYHESSNLSVTEAYTNLTYPVSTRLPQYRTFYDHYDLDRDGTDEFTFNASEGYSNSHPEETLPGQVVATASLFLDHSLGTLDATNQWYVQVVFKDERLRSIQVQDTFPRDVSQPAGQRNTQVSNRQYDFSGNLIARKWSQNAFGFSTSRSYSYTNDRTGRKQRVIRNGGYSYTNEVSEFVSVDDLERTEIDYRYNAIGQVVEKNYDGDPAANYTFTQSVDLAYHIRGWLKSINQKNVGLPEQKFTEPGRKLTPSVNFQDRFGEVYYYDEASPVGQGGHPIRYDGKLTALQFSETNSVAQGNILGYIFAYDHAGRYTESNYNVEEISSGDTYNYQQQDSERILAYDLNSNVKRIQRSVGINFADDITLTYDGNQLINATEGSTVVETTGHQDFRDDGVNGPSVTEYTYDSNGSLLADDNIGMSMMYNYHKKVVKMTKGTEVVTYRYTSSGIKLFESEYVGGNHQLISYEFGPVKYAYNPTYDSNGNPSGRYEFVRITELTGHSFYDWRSNQPLPGPTYKRLVGQHTRTLELRDRLGSVRGIVDVAAGTVTSSSGVLTEILHYYPSGLRSALSASLTSGTGAQAKYQFQGQERLTGITGYYGQDHGYRVQNPQTMQWHGVDPYAAQRSGNGTYSYMGGDPVNRVDPTGGLDDPITNPELLESPARRYGGYGGAVARMQHMINAGTGGGGHWEGPLPGMGGYLTANEYYYYALNPDARISYQEHLWNKKRGVSSGHEFSYLDANGYPVIGWFEYTDPESVTGCNCNCPNPPCEEDWGPGWAVAAGIAVAEPTPIGEAAVGTAAGLWWVYNSVDWDGLIAAAEAAAQSVRQAAQRVKQDRPDAIVYELKARESGFYKDAYGNSIFLNEGDTWKYGMTSKNVSPGRYSRSEVDFRLAGGPLVIVPLFFGNHWAASTFEVTAINVYRLTHWGNRPPGNKRTK